MDRVGSREKFRIIDLDLESKGERKGVVLIVNLVV